MTLPELPEVNYGHFRRLMGSWCRSIDDDNEPVLIVLGTTRPGDRRPAVCMPHRLWEQIQHHHPELEVPEDKIQYMTRMRDAQGGLTRNILRPAAKTGVHTIAQPSRGEEPWHVAYVPRAWWDKYAQLAQ